MKQRRIQLLAVVLCAAALFASRTANAAPAAQPGADADRTGGGRDAVIRTAASAYKRTDHSVPVVVLTIEIDAAALGLVETKRGHTGPFAVRWMATDPQGRTRSGELYNGLLTLSAEEYTRAARHGVRVVSRIELPPGLYRLRVNAISTARTESLVSDLEVPEFTAPLAMSGISLSSAASDDELPALAPRSPSPVALPATPTARREFESGETLIVFAEVYESRRRLEQGPTRGRKGDPAYRELGDHTTNLAIELRARDGSILMTVPAERSSLGQPAGTHAFQARLPLTGVPTGRYVLRLRARANIGDADIATRDIAIRIRSGAAQGKVHSPRRQTRSGPAIAHRRA